ncbi:hypothetical protein BJ875DRAFT_340548, partial [Amylocarpus encephaloides]
SSSMKRWTNGVPWSSSRILGNFLVYRELERPFPPCEKKQSKRSPGIKTSGGFKEEGLVKKSIGVTVSRVSHHLVSYYIVPDIMN